MDLPQQQILNAYTASARMHLELVSGADPMNLRRVIRGPTADIVIRPVQALLGRKAAKPGQIDACIVPRFSPAFDVPEDEQDREEEDEAWLARYVASHGPGFVLTYSFGL